MLNVRKYRHRWFRQKIRLFGVWEDQYKILILPSLNNYRQLPLFFNSISYSYRSRKPRLRPWGIRRTDHATPLYPQNLTLTSPTSGGRSVGIVRSLTKDTELV
jgi:hypothetical protein